MTEALCDAMDCANTRPISTAIRDKPHFGYCQSKQVNTLELFSRSDRPTCITYDKKETEQRSGE